MGSWQLFPDVLKELFFFLNMLAPQVLDNKDLSFPRYFGMLSIFSLWLVSFIDCYNAAFLEA